MKNILLIHTGGTISMMEDEKTGEVKPDAKNPLVDYISEIPDTVLITSELFHLPSPHITPNHMLKIKEYIERNVNERSINGVVITHGTDTLEETAFFLDITLSLDIPIVITGAMRSSNELGSDGLYNLIAAIKVASSEKAKNLGVLVVMNDEIHTAKNVTKTHTSNIATFQSPQYGPIGIVNKGGVLFHHKPKTSRHLNVKHLDKNVLLLKAFAGMDDSLLKAISSLKLDGLVIEALGQGNLPPYLLPELKTLLNKGIPIILVSRCFNGIVQDVYGYEGGGRHLKELGMIFSNGLNGQKARLKLMIALETTSNHKELEEIFSE
ncbi:asparaginase [Metabacillus niabensis]|uniref:asparaginase n=1 Tax=Metabacillus niabensis TaxID=324854 RepID=A0ABT9YZ66_9BACI|nr:asparaginase [Metabacillus niabensis]MDQ0225075.1 L-asparaginase [Metabacillus niabensis]PAD68282.1 L-asparaginase [Bacillus sp. 7586-K]